MKKIVSVFIAIIIALSAFTGCGKVKINPNATLYVEDVDALKSTLEINHPNLYSNCSKEDLDAAIEDLEKDIQTTEMSDTTINYRMKEICAMLKDGHVNYNNSNSDDGSIFPIKGEYFGDDYYIIFADTKYKEALGGKLISINNIPFDEIKKRYSKIISYENNQHLKACIDGQVFTEECFRYLDILKKKNTFKVQTLNGEVKEFNVEPIDKAEFKELVNDEENSLAIDKTNKPICISKPENASDAYWYILDKENRILYFQYNTCLDKNDNLENSGEDTSSLPIFSEFEAGLNEYMKKNANQFDKIVVDVRKNGGGMSEHMDRFVRENAELLNSKKVNVLMSKYTFSAGVMAVDTLVKNCNATMIGEETGGPADLFYKMSFVKLSSMGGTVQCSFSGPFNCKYAGKNSTERYQGAIPDIKVNCTLEDVMKGKDLPYEAAINEK